MAWGRRMTFVGRVGGRGLAPLYTVCSISFGLIKNQAVIYFGIRDAWYNNELFSPVFSLSVLYTEHNVTLSRTSRYLPATECVQVQDNTVVEMLWFSLGSERDSRDNVRSTSLYTNCQHLTMHHYFSWVENISSLLPADADYFMYTRAQYIYRVVNGKRTVLENPSLR